MLYNFVQINDYVQYAWSLNLEEYILPELFEVFVIAEYILFI
ncbi:hypothetical protein [Desulfovulcanus ferrireducens]|nr:hypothetical protein [Desulfovulcanus ferrireducens]